jgi:hypothetical protein
MTTATAPIRMETPSLPTSRVNTKTARRRLVAYASLADFSTDLDKLEAAHRAGTLRVLGNHAPGPNFAHLAASMQRSFDGFPVTIPRWLRLLGRLMKNRILSRPFQPGFNLSKAAESSAWNDRVSFDEGLAALRAQIARAAKPDARPSAPHPFFGPMTTPQWQTYHLRHAELHMSFLQPAPPSRPG